MRSEVQADLAAVEVLLPLRLEALLAAESQVDVFLDQLGTGHNETLSYALKLIVNEGFRNALELEPVEGRLRLVRLLMQAGPGGIAASSPARVLSLTAGIETARLILQAALP